MTGISCQHLQVMVTKLLRKHGMTRRKRSHTEHGSVIRPTAFGGPRHQNNFFGEARLGHVAKNHGKTRHTRMVDRGPPASDVGAGREGHVRQGDVGTPGLWQKMASQLLAMWRRFGQEQKWASSWTSKVKRHIRYPASCVTPSGLMLRDSIAEAGRWDLAPNPASLL